MSSLDSFRVPGARALVTGASRGIGRATALALSEAGARLALSARDTEALKETAELATGGPPPVVVPGDLSRPETGGDVVDQAAAALGGLDIVVHNTGVVPHRPDGTAELVPLQAGTQEGWDAVLTVNLDATAAVCRRAHAHLARSSQASLVLMSSVSALLGTPLLEAYAASKAAQVSLARSLAVGWARDGIRVNALCPGWTRTDMTEFAHTTEPVSDWLMSHVPLGRWAEPEEVALAVLYLASPASSYLTGHALVLDGGVAVADGGLAGVPKPPSPFAAA